MLELTSILLIGFDAGLLLLAYVKYAFTCQNTRAEIPQNLKMEIRKNIKSENTLT